MIDPYKMVAVNLIVLAIITFGLITHIYIYPKKRVNFLFLLIIISIPPLISILRKGAYESGDMSIHAKIAMDFYTSLSEGNIIPRVSSMLCGGHSCPDFIFMYMFPYYLTSIFHLIGFSFINSIKLLLALSFIISGIGMYFWAKDELGRIPAFSAGVFYLFTPYHLVNMHFRIDIAEMVSYAILPFCFLFSKKFIESGRYLFFLLQWITVFLLLLSHQAISLFSFPFIITYGILTWLKIKKRKIKNLIYYFLSLLLGIILSSFFWVPAIFEGKFTYWSTVAKTSFPDFLSFFYSPWRFGLLFQGPMGELSPAIGYIHLFVILLSILLVINTKLFSNIIRTGSMVINKILKVKKNYHIDNRVTIMNTKNKNIFLFFIFSFFIVFFMMQSASEPLWKIIPLIKNFQFSSRLLTLTSLFSAMIAAVIIKEIKNKYLIILICFLTIFITILNWGNRGTYPLIDDYYLKDELLHKSYNGIDLVTPIWVNTKAQWINTPSDYQLETINGEANITPIQRNSTKHEYIIQVKKTSLLRENTFYFPGWELAINNKLYPFTYNDSKYSGLIIFSLDPGIYKIELFFEDTPIRRISKIISFISFSALLVCLIIYINFKIRQYNR
ncbi:MAG: hypothetical protein A2857_01140 [Candidatus Levybacteria bacterium RIFCSPHIGHO2_01_FULL_36_15]|nr:MAG: hypothetical protein A2857_01140 [Candidatus Levybacteria bacterium RIFCSPHIGHO2_01_FULL_36_15]